MKLSRILLIPLVVLALLMGCSDNPGSVEVTDNSLEDVTPEDVGYSSEALEEAEDLAEQGNYAAAMALHDGKVFFSYGDISRNYICHSIRKPFLSAL